MNIDEQKRSELTKVPSVGNKKMEIEKTLTPSMSLKKKKSLNEIHQHKSSALRQSKLEQFGIKSPMRSLFTDSSKILSPKEDAKTTCGVDTSTEDLNKLMKIADLNRNPSPNSVKENLKSNNHKAPVINFKQLSDKFKTKIVNGKSRGNDEHTNLLKHQDSNRTKESKPALKKKPSKPIEFSDDDDELLEVEFLKPQNKSECHSSSSPATDNNDNNSNKELNYGIASILNERECPVDTRKEILEMEIELKNERTLDSENLEDKNGVLNENELKLETFELKALQITSSHPGIEVFDLSKCCQLYHLPSLPNVVVQNPITNSLDYLLASVSSEDLPSILPLANLDSKPKVFSEQPCMLNYFFHLLASHPDPHVVYSCYKILVNVQEYFINNLKDLSATKMWTPSLIDLVAVLINYGASLAVLHPEPTLLSFTEEQVHSIFGKDANQACQFENKEQVFRDDNLKKVLDVFSRFEEIPNAYTNEDLMNITIVCLTLGLDKKLMEIIIERELTLCIGNALAHIKNDFWESKMKDLVNLLLKVPNHHHNIVSMARLMPHSERGLQLQKVLAYNALHVVLDVEMECQKFAVKPHHVYDFFKKHVHNKISGDFYLFSSVISLIDLCIGKTLGRASRTTMQDFITTMKDAASKIRDSIQCADATEVKNYIINLATNWTFLVQNLPSSQASLLNYVSRRYRIDPIPLEVDEEVNAADVGSGEAESTTTKCTKESKTDDE